MGKKLDDSTIKNTSINSNNLNLKYSTEEIKTVTENDILKTTMYV